MDWIRPYLISRVRVAALRAQMRAGGPCSSGQLRRAIEPVVGNLLPYPGTVLEDPEERAKAEARYAALEAEDLRRDLASWPIPRSRRAEAVVK